MAEQGDFERTSRLQVLQMEDLGLERRDYLSTRDAGNKHFVSLRRLEASRASNQEGTWSHILAEQNKEKLNAWKDAWKTFGDDAETDELMPILDGQSHRYNLMQAIKANGGQKYETEPDTSVHPRGRRALGAPGNTGRGGGVIGSRGRQQSFSQKSSNSTGTRGKARAAAGNLFMPSRPRDPARDSNNPQSPPRRGARGRANVRRPSTIRQRIPIVPHPNIKFDAMLADSASFMAAVSNLRSSQSSPRTVASPGKQEHVNVNDESRLKQDFLLSHDEGSDDIEPDEPLDSGVDLKAKKIIDETQKKNAAEATSVAPDNADMELEQPIVDTIEVFRSPSIKNENQTDSSKPKVACGFKSSLPQPGVFMRRRKPPINKPQTDDHDDLDSLPRSSASSTIVLEPAFSSTSQATGESMGHEQSSNATETPTHLEQKASQGADESMAPQKDVESERKELMELEETLSKATLPASVRNFLQARKEQLEGLIYLRATRPVDPATINQPSKEVAGRPRGTSVQARASQTEVPTLIRETAQDSQAPAMTARPKVMFALATRPAMEPIARKPDVVRAFEALDAVRNDEENIIGNHLLPGRTPMIPVAPTPVPASAPAPVATASQTLYGTQLKMRETPYLPQTAAAKQYAGLSSQASPPMPTSSHQRTQQQGALRAPRQSVTNAGCGALSPPSRGRAADRDRGHKRLDSKVSASDSGPSGGSSQASGNSNIMNRGQANLRKASARTTNEPLKSILNDQFVSRRIAGNANQAPKVPESPVGGLAGSKWVVDDELQDKAEKPRKSASSDLESSIWASSDDKNKDKGLSASRWAH